MLSVVQTGKLIHLVGIRMELHSIKSTSQNFTDIVERLVTYTNALKLLFPVI